MLRQILIRNEETETIWWGTFEEFQKELPEEAEGAVVVPEEEYTASDICEMFSNILEDLNMHRITRVPHIMLNTARRIGLEEEKQKEIVLEFIKELANELFDMATIKSLELPD